MNNGVEEFQFDSEAEELLARYLGEVWKALTDNQASPAEAREIAGELQDHILQAYWKESNSRFVTINALQAILETMGDPHEVASEYLLDWRDTWRLQKKSSTKKRSAPSAQSPSQTNSSTQHGEFYLLALPIAAFIGILSVLIVSSERSIDNWTTFLAIADIFLVLPLIWYFTTWKNSKDLNIWTLMSPDRLRVYLRISVILLLQSCFFLLFTKEGSFIMASLMQLSLIILFLVAAQRILVSWEQSDVKFTLLDVKLPAVINDTGLLMVETTNYNPMTFSQVRMSILGQSHGLQMTIAPLTRRNFGFQETITWYIHFTPKVGGMLTFGRVILQLEEKMSVSSPVYSFNVQERADSSKLSSLIPKSGTIDNFPVIPDFEAACGICRQSFQNKDSISFCQLCGSLFHLSHLQEWLKNHQKCPICKKPIRIPIEEGNYGQIIRKHINKLEGQSQRLKNLLENSEGPQKESNDLVAK